MNLKLPKNVVVAGWKIPIRVTAENIGPDYHGAFNADRMEININPNTPDPWETLYHEVVHAAMILGGVHYSLGDKDAEAVVRCLEKLFFPAFKALHLQEIKDNES